MTPNWLLLQGEDPDLTILATLCERGRRALEFSSQVLYGTEFDAQVKVAVRWGQTMAEFCDHENVTLHWKKIADDEDDEDKKAKKPGQSKDLDPESDAPPPSDPVKSALVDLVTNVFHDEDVSQQAANDKAVAWLEKAEKKGQVQEVVAATQEANRTVKSTCVLVDASQSLPALATSLRGYAITKMRGTTEKSVLMWWDVDQSGQGLVHCD